MSLNIKKIINNRCIDLDYIKYMTGISKDRLYKWQHGKYDPRISEINKISSLFKIEVYKIPVEEFIKM